MSFIEDSGFDTSHVIGVVGPSGSGKTSCIFEAVLLLREKYGIMIDALDSGTLFRTATIIILRNNIDINNPDKCGNILLSHKIEPKLAEINDKLEQEIYLDGDNITQELRSEIVDKTVAVIGRYEQVRIAMEKIQYQIADGKKIFVVGRDIGTNVMPNNLMNLFITASLRTRAIRRMAQRGIENTEENLKDMMIELAVRDDRDTNRLAGPYRVPANAITISNEGTKQETINQIIESVLPRIQ
jgi:cytidylate kinase